MLSQLCGDVAVLDAKGVLVFHSRHFYSNERKKSPRPAAGFLRLSRSLITSAAIAGDGAAQAVVHEVTRANARLRIGRFGLGNREIIRRVGEVVDVHIAGRPDQDDRIGDIRAVVRDGLDGLAGRGAAFLQAIAEVDGDRGCQHAAVLLAITDADAARACGIVVAGRRDLVQRRCERRAIRGSTVMDSLPDAAGTREDYHGVVDFLLSRNATRTGRRAYR